MANKKPLNLDALVNASKNVETAAKPESAPIDLSSVGGVALSHVAGGEPVDISHLYGERGGLVGASPAIESSDEE
jgi:hypothetical protein